MQYSEIIKNVQAAAKVDDKAAAEKAIQATLETLKQRIIGDEAENLAAQLPEEIGQHLRGRAGENGDHFPLKEFYQKVSQIEGVDLETAATHVQGVFSALGSAVTSGEFSDIKNDLSDDYAELFPANAS